MCLLFRLVLSTIVILTSAPAFTSHWPRKRWTWRGRKKRGGIFSFENKIKCQLRWITIGWGEQTNQKKFFLCHDDWLLNEAERVPCSHSFPSGQKSIASHRRTERRQNEIVWYLLVRPGFEHRMGLAFLFYGWCENCVCIGKLLAYSSWKSIPCRPNALFCFGFFFFFQFLSLCHLNYRANLIFSSSSDLYEMHLNVQIWVKNKKK